MASADGRERAGVSRDLFVSPYRFDFFQAVRLLEHRRREREIERARSGHAREPHLEGNGVGRDLHPHSEVVRFRALPSLGFPAATISEIRAAAASSHDRGEPPPPEMLVTFLSLTGPCGALPRHYTELLLQRIREKDFSLRDFLDLFNHRLISLFYRAWEKYNWAIAYERSQLDDPASEPDPVTRGVYDLVGLGTTGLRGRLDVNDEVFLFYSGHYAHLPRSSLALESLLADYLDLPVGILQCQGQWLSLELDDQARMPSATLPNGRNNRLGVNLVVGERIWDVQSKFRVRLGPLKWRQFRSLMPNGKGLRPLCQMTRLYVGPALDFDVQPVLKPEEVPACQLTTNPDEGSYLGWNTWMPAPMAPTGRPVDDALFQIPTI
jgi:type VI secretion system protein ImpH